MVTLVSQELSQQPSVYFGRDLLPILPYLLLFLLTRYEYVSPVFFHFKPTF